MKLNNLKNKLVTGALAATMMLGSYKDANSQAIKSKEGVNDLPNTEVVDYKDQFLDKYKEVLDVDRGFSQAEAVKKILNKINELKTNKYAYTFDESFVKTLNKESFSELLSEIKKSQNIDELEAAGLKFFQQQPKPIFENNMNIEASEEVKGIISMMNFPVELNESSKEIIRNELKELLINNLEDFESFDEEKNALFLFMLSLMVAPLLLNRKK